MSPTPTPTPSPHFIEGDGWSQVPDAIPLAPGHPCLNSGSMKCILDHQQQTADELNAQSTSTMSAQEFNALMDGHPATNAAPIVAGVVLSVLVLVAAAVTFVRNRRAHGTSPAPATAEV